MLRITLVLISAIATSSCASRNPTTSQAESDRLIHKSKAERTTLNAKLSEILEGIDGVLSPLKDLEPKERAALQALIALSEVMSDYSSNKRMAESSQINRYSLLLQKYCPDLPRFTASRGSCIDEMISYASAVKDCEEEGKKEWECPKLMESSAALVACQMRELEALIEKIRRLPEGPRPLPMPFGH